MLHGYSWKKSPQLDTVIDVHDWTLYDFIQAMISIKLFHDCDQYSQTSQSLLFGIANDRQSYFSWAIFQFSIPLSLTEINLKHG